MRPPASGEQAEHHAATEPAANTVPAPSPLFTPRMRPVDLLSAYPDAQPVCQRLRIDLQQPLAQWCHDPGWILVELARAARPPSPTAPRDWSLATIPELVADIIASHHRPLLNELRRLGVLIAEYCQRHAARASHELIRSFVRFEATLLEHMAHEEGVVFPLSILVEQASRQRDAVAPITGDITAAIRFMSAGHDEALTTLRRIIATMHEASMNDFDPDSAIISAGLVAMLADFVVHESKEEDILLPAVIFAEEQLRARRRRRDGDGSRSDGRRTPTPTPTA